MTASDLRDLESGGSDVVYGNGRPPAVGSGPVERIAFAQPTLPCPGCAHSAVCSIRSALETADLSLRTPGFPNPAIRVRLTVEVECAHFLTAPPPEPTRVDSMTASRQRGAAGLVKARAVKAEKRAAGSPGKRSAETRERMRQAQLARFARKRAESE